MISLMKRRRLPHEETTGLVSVSFGMNGDETLEQLEGLADLAGCLLLPECVYDGRARQVLRRPDLTVFEDGIVQFWFEVLLCNPSKACLGEWVARPFWSGTDKKHFEQPAGAHGWRRVA